MGHNGRRLTDHELVAERTAERWLLRNGYPYLLKFRSLHHDLIGRSYTGLSYGILLYLCGVASVAVAYTWVPDAENSAWTLLVLFVGLLVLPVVLTVALGRARRNRPLYTRWADWMPLLVLLIVLPILDNTVLLALDLDLDLGDDLSGTVDPDQAPDILGGIANNAVFIVTVLVLTWSGLGSLAAKAGRSIVSQFAALGQMTSLALPVVTVVILFAFLTQSTWELAVSMTLEDMLLYAAFLLALEVFVILAITRAEVKTLDESIPIELRQSKLAASTLAPFAALATRPGPPLRRVESGNIQVVLILAQLFQALFFILLVFVFLILLGSIVTEDDLIERWTHETPEYWNILGIPTQLTSQTIVVSIFLSLFAGLNFVLSLSSNGSYKDAFYEPLLDSARTALSVRALYRQEEAVEEGLEPRAAAEDGLAAGPEPTPPPQ